MFNKTNLATVILALALTATPMGECASGPLPLEYKVCGPARLSGLVPFNAP